MAAELDVTNTDRRTLLKKLAVAGVITALPLVESSPAFADAGTMRCRHTYTGSATVSVRIGRDAAFAGGADEYFKFTQTAVPTGVCLCGGTATITYSYRVVFSSTATGGVATSTATSIATLTTGQIQNGLLVGATDAMSNFNYNIQMGVYITCPGGTPARRICRFATVAGFTSLNTTYGVHTGAITMVLNAASSANLPGC